MPYKKPTAAEIALVAGKGRNLDESFALVKKSFPGEVPNKDALRKRLARVRESIEPSEDAGNVTIPKDAKGKIGASELIVPWRGPAPARLTVDSDIHFPLHHKAFLEAKLKFIEDIKPDVHVSNGDIWDFTNLSRYDRDPRFVHSVKDEFASSKEYCARISKAAKRWYVIPGNHEVRLWKTVCANHALFGLLSDIKELAKLPEKATVLQYGTELQIGNAWIQHGDQTKTQNPTYWLVSHGLALLTLIGHHHRPGSYIRIQRDHNGRLVRREAHALGHGQDIDTVTHWAGTTPRWALGFAYVEQHGDDFAVHQIIANDKGEFTFNGKRYKG